MKTIQQALIASVFALLGLAAAAQVPQPPDISAPTYLVLDVSANQVLAARNVDAPVEPASLTKLMSAYVVFGALHGKKLDMAQTLPVSERAWRMRGSRMFIDPTMRVAVDDLIKGMVVQSGNDATVALAEGVGGTVEHFVELMNQQAQMMGLRATHYKNVEGLTEAGHSTTARDLSILSIRLLQDFPDYLGYYVIKNYHYPGTPKSNDTNRNTLLFRDPTVDGLKTGHTDAAGYCLVATAKRDVAGVGARRLLVIVLGAANERVRTDEAQRLLNWGYAAFEDIKLFDANQPVVTADIWKGVSKTVKLGRREPVVVSVPTGMTARLKTQVSRPNPLFAPLTQGQSTGVLKISSGDLPLLEVPLVALENVEPAGLLGRAWDSLRLLIK